MPMQPTAFIDVTMISPANPALAISAAGHFCWITRMVGRFIASSASTTSMKLSRPEKFGSGSPNTHVTAYPTIAPISG